MRLAGRLAVAMMLVTTTSLAVVVGVQAYFARDELHRLPDDLRMRLGEIRRADDAAPWPFTTPLRPPPEGAHWTGTGTGTDGGHRTGDGATSLLWSAWAVGRVQDAQWRGIAWGLAIAAAASLALAWWIARGVARPVEAVGAAAKALAAGRLTSRASPLRSRLGAAAEVRALTDDFNRMADALERLEAERTATVADVAHELRTPLAAMLLRLEALREGLAPLDQEEVGRLLRHGRLLHRLVEDLRTLSLADGGRLKLRPEDVDLALVAREAADALAPLALERGAAVEASGPDDVDPPRVRGDATRLAQVLGNLIENAVRATPAGGRVRLRTFCAGAEAGWVVSDDGPGIPDADLPHLFERFRQGEHGRRDLRGTSGLGLAIVHTLVGAHGGQVAARNRPGGGAELTVTLPRAGGCRGRA